MRMFFLLCWCRENIYISSSSCNFCWVLLHFAAITSLVFSYFPRRETFLTTKTAGNSTTNFISPVFICFRWWRRCEGSCFPSAPRCFQPLPPHYELFLVQDILFVHPSSWNISSMKGYLELGLPEQPWGSQEREGEGSWGWSAGLLWDRCLWTAGKRKLCVSGKPDTTRICTGLNRAAAAAGRSRAGRGGCGGKCIPGTPRKGQSWCSVSATEHPAHRDLHKHPSLPPTLSWEAAARNETFLMEFVPRSATAGGDGCLRIPTDSTKNRNERKRLRYKFNDILLFVLPRLSETVGVILCHLPRSLFLLCLSTQSSKCPQPLTPPWELGHHPIPGWQGPSGMCPGHRGVSPAPSGPRHSCARLFFGADPREPVLGGSS